VPVKEFLKSVNIWRRYGQKYGGMFFFDSQCSSSYTTSGDIFYCSGSRQLNHSSFCMFFVCPSRYVARHRKPRRCVYALNLSPPDSFSYRSSFRSRSSSSSTTSGDIFYCSGSRQLNHSSFLFSLKHLGVMKLECSCGVGAWKHGSSSRTPVFP